MSVLRPSWWTLLDELCRAQSAASGNFLAVGRFGGTFIRHDGLPEPLKDFAFSDLNELQAKGMIRLTGKSGSSTRFEITNDGWKYWKTHQKTGIERIEAEVRRLLDPAGAVAGVLRCVLTTYSAVRQCRARLGWAEAGIESLKLTSSRSGSTSES